MTSEIIIFVGATVTSFIAIYATLVRLTRSRSSRRRRPISRKGALAKQPLMSTGEFAGVLQRQARSRAVDLLRQGIQQSQVTAPSTAARLEFEDRILEDLRHLKTMFHELFDPATAARFERTLEQVENAVERGTSDLSGSLDRALQSLIGNIDKANSASSKAHAHSEAR